MRCTRGAVRARGEAGERAKECRRSMKRTLHVGGHQGSLALVHDLCTPHTHPHLCGAGVKPVVIELTDFKTKKKVDELEVDAVMVATGR